MAEKEYIELDEAMKICYKEYYHQLEIGENTENDKAKTAIKEIILSISLLPTVESVEVFDHTATEMAYNNGFEAGMEKGKEKTSDELCKSCENYQKRLCVRCERMYNDLYQPNEKMKGEKE